MNRRPPPRPRRTNRAATPAGPIGRTGGATGGPQRGRSGRSARDTVRDTSARGTSGGKVSPRDRRGLGGEQVEGRQAVRELLVAGRRRVREVMVAADLEGASGILADIAELAAAQRVPLRRVGPGKLAALARSEAPQGVVARAAPLEEADLDELAAGPSRSATPAATPFLVALDGVTDPGNLGAILRTAECAGVTGVVLPRHRAAHVTPTVAKAAAGAIEHLPIAVVAGLPSALSRLRELGVWSIGLDMDGEPIDRLTIAAEPVVLVVGSEGRGLSRLVRQRCDVVSSIPLRGRLGSLNAAAAAAIACWEITRRRTK
jgi:23S rRNA (guanosine2251-2'-O)-methyltransferase